MTRFLLAALLASTAAFAAPVAPTPSKDPVADLNAMYADFWEENLKLNPLTATQAGDPRYNAELPNIFAPDYRAQLQTFHQKYLDRAHAIVGAGGEKQLTGQDRLSFDIFTLNRESELEDFEF